MDNYRVHDRIIMMILSPLSCKLASKYIYWRAFHRKLNLENPQTFDEKLMWLKLNAYAKNPLITKCVDKYEVREYIRELGYEEILVPLIGVWNRPEDIPFNDLPGAFALKCNHGCGYNIICSDSRKLDITAVRKKLHKWIKEEFWLRFAECNYRDVSKKILCEEYLGTVDGIPPMDYKFYCFHGKAEYVMVCCERGAGKTKYYFYNRDWKLERINPDGVRADKDFYIPRPEKLDEMFAYADALSKPFPFVRVDLYASDSYIKFGEFTFTPAAALDTARLPQADRIFYEKLKLPQFER